MSDGALVLQVLPAQAEAEQPPVPRLLRLQAPAGVAQPREGACSMTSIPEPDHTWIVVDHDGYFWRWDVDEWKCLSAAGNESWHVLVEVFGPLQVYAPATQTDDGAAVAGPTLRPAVSPPAPSSPIPRRFQMYRHHDVSGVSGTGLIAEGTEYRDGVVSLRWYGEHPSEVWWPSVDEILAVHGHQGATEIRWIDEPPIDYWPTEGATR